MLLEHGADEAPAILAPGRTPLNYRELRGHLRLVGAQLAGYGIGRADRVALVLGNGPEMATAFLAALQAAAAAPLNPGYKAEEFAFYLEDLGAKALIVEKRVDSPVREVADRLGITILELTPSRGAAGLFSLSSSDGSQTDAAAPASMPGADDVALILHTSGTTSRPKIVPLTQRNLAASAQNVAATLNLSDNDRGLHVMPMFHIHGLIAGLLAPLVAGGSVFCTPGFDALKFFSWLAESTPTWYTAVPTMHQAILSRASRNRAVLDSVELRFIRSSSASLAPQVMAEIEETFGAPVIEAYGMTEAAHQMTSNPLPPRPRKPGSVGVPAGPEVAILDSKGTVLAANATGEVCIRGDNVMAGYEKNDDANQVAFTGGWFRTGDQGVIDDDGYLHITGRLKEIINRGGEKISPREVDEVLLAHPAIAQVLTFAMPHDKLGEEVAAAVVLVDGESVDERELRDYAGERLAAFKVPRRIIFLERIPTGPTGKLQRIGLADTLGLTK